MHLVDGADVDDDGDLLEELEGFGVLGLDCGEFGLVHGDLGGDFFDLFLGEVGLLLLHLELELA